MTGDILRRLREAYGFSQRAVAGVMQRDSRAVSRLESGGRSWGSGREGPAERCRRHDRFLVCLDALRILRKKPPKRAPAATKKTKTEKGSAPVDKAPYKPAGATHQIERRGIKEWVRIIPMHGTLRGFAWQGEWVRAAWVEGSSEFQAELLAARLPQRKHKVRAIAGGVDEYHHAMREWVY